MTYRDLWLSGRLSEVAAECRTVGELAKRFGVTTDALASGLQRLRASGMSIPALGDMVMQRQVGPVDPDLDDWGEPTEERPLLGIEEPIPVSDSRLEPVAEHRLQRKVRELEAERKSLLEQMRKMEDALDLAGEAASCEAEPIHPTLDGSGQREATAVALLSDLHIEETVRPEQCSHLNEFNLEIAKRRLTRAFEGIRWLIEHHRQAFHIETLVLAVIGDIISGHIHDDLVESTSLSPTQAIATIEQWLDDGIRFLLDDPRLRRIVIPWVDGNHDRLTKEIRVATRTRHSLGWLAGVSLARRFKDEPRVEFVVAESDMLYLDVYSYTLRFIHGDAVKYGGGVGGVSVPMNRAIARWDVGKRADWTCHGHFHQLGWGSATVSNGSLIGWGPFSQRIAAAYEPPAQAFFLVDSKRGRCMMTPVWVDE